MKDEWVFIDKLCILKFSFIDLGNVITLFVNKAIIHRKLIQKKFYNIQHIWTDHYPEGLKELRQFKTLKKD